MKLFIIGAGGFLGKELLKFLLDSKEIESICCMVHHSDLNLNDERIKTIRGDVREADRINTDIQYDACILMSGVLNGRGVKPSDVMNVNYKGALQTIKFCENNQIPRLYFVSSINVLIEKKGAYALSKDMAERAIKGSGLDYMIFRPALIYGYRQAAGLGVIESFIRKYGMVPVFGDGKKMEQPVPVWECAQIMAYYILNQIEGRTVEIRGKDAFSYNELCREIGHILKRKVRIIHLPIKPFEILLSITEKLEMRLSVSLEQIYHIDTDLNGDMKDIYIETGITGRGFAENFLINE